MPKNPDLINFTVTLTMQIDANEEDHEYLAQRMNSALYHAIHGAGLTRACPDSQATVIGHHFSLEIDPELTSAERMLLTDGLASPGNTMAPPDMPGTPGTTQEDFATGWHEHQKLLASLAQKSAEQDESVGPASMEIPG